MFFSNLRQLGVRQLCLLIGPRRLLLHLNLFLASFLDPFLY
jgi:hypothetical protein